MGELKIYTTKLSFESKEAACMIITTETIKISAVINEEMVEWAAALQVSRVISNTDVRITIGEVLVHPDYRHKQLASTVLINLISMYIDSFHSMRDGEKEFTVAVPAGKSIYIDRIMFSQCSCDYVINDINETANWEMKIK